METLKIRYLADGLPELRPIDGKSDWVDLYAAETVALSAGDFRLIPLGVAIALPDGYEAHIVPRSSTFRNYGVLQTNSMGVVDNSYRGDGDEWKFPAYATRDATIEKGARICQFRIVKNQPALRFETVEHLPDDNRGGFGSTGTGVVVTAIAKPINSEENNHSGFASTEKSKEGRDGNF